MDIANILELLKMKLIKLKNIKLLIITFVNIISFLFLYHHHRLYLSEGSFYCNNSSCQTTLGNKNFSDSRNKQSTPTEFLLPSSTAVANIQEENKIKKLNINDIKCLIELDNNGFKVLDLNSAYKANSIAAIFEFQLASKISTDGKLNELTRAKLGC
jgi:hypothetical protein